jgi:hypothetical protein
MDVFSILKSSRFAIHQQIDSDAVAGSAPSSVIEKTPQFFLFSVFSVRLSVPSANAKLVPAAD